MSPSLSDESILTIVQLGRCGKGAVQLAKDVGIPDSNIIQWDMAETKKGSLLQWAKTKRNG